MKLQEGGGCVAGTSRDFAGVRSLGDAEQQADHQMAPEQPAELLCKFGRAAREQSRRLGSGHDFTHGGPACLTSSRVEHTRYFWGLDRLSDRQPEYRNDLGIAYLADEPRRERSQHLLQGLAIAQCRKVSGHVKSLGALADAGDQHFLFVANPRVELSLRNARARGDLKRASRCVAALHERRKGRLKDALAHRAFVAAFLAAF